MHELDFNRDSGFSGERAYYAFSFEGDIASIMQDESDDE